MILARNQLLQTNPNDSEKRAKAIFLIQEAAQQIQSITKSVRDLYGLEYGKRKLPVREISVLESLSNAISAIIDKAEAKKVAINLEQFNDMKVLVEPTALSFEIVTNILSNAIKFSDPGSQIRIRVLPKPDDPRWVTIHIRDYGIGIPDSILNEIYNLGSPTSRTGTSGESGTGFGMPIVKNYIEAMGGKIRINSTTIDANPIDHGTEMILHLRRASENPHPS